MHIQKRREEEGRVLHLLLNESFFLEKNRVAANRGSVLRSHAQRVSGLLKNDET